MVQRPNHVAGGRKPESTKIAKNLAFEKRVQLPLRIFASLLKFLNCGRKLVQLGAMLGLYY
jgi:hypothetical protein